MMSKSNINKLLILILTLALFLRLNKISFVPPSLNWDEISHGYNAYSILKTGKDEWGIRFPLIFRAYGDFKLPLYIYLATVTEALFGLNVVGVRLVSVLAGVGLVFLSYLLSKKILKKESLSLISAFLTAVSPWSLFVSRVAVEANLGAFLFATGMYFWLCWLDEYRLKNLILASFSWGLALHAYNSARILVPICILITIWRILRQKRIRQLAPHLILISLFFLPIIFQFFNQSAKARFNWVSLIDQGTISRIIEKRTTSNLPKPFSSILFNKGTFFIYYAFKNYILNLSPGYLFFKGGSHYQFSLPDHELLYLVTAPFLLLGLLRAFKKRDIQSKVLLFWVFGAFIPSAITKDAPHVLRSLLVLPVPMVLTTSGIEWIVNFLEKKSAFKGEFMNLMIIICVVISFFRWWNDYFKIYPKIYSWAWQYGYKEVVSFIKESYMKYDKIFITKRYGEPHEFILFYWPWEPDKYQNEPKIWDYHANWYWVDRFDKFEFINDWEIKDKLKIILRQAQDNTEQSRSIKNEKLKMTMKNEKILLITSPGNYPEGWRKIKQIDFLDGKTAFEILESN